MGILPAGVYAPCLCARCLECSKSIESFGVELVVSLHVSAENRARASARATCS